MFCNISFGEVLPKHKVALFGIVLGDSIDNYKISTKHFSHPSCEKIKPTFERGKDCYRPNIQEKRYNHFFSFVEPLIINDEYNRYYIEAFFGSKKINEIGAKSKKQWKPEEQPLCERRAKNINKLITAKYKEQGWKKTGDFFIISEMEKGIAAFEIVTFCSGPDLVLIIRENDKGELLKEDRIFYMSTYDEPINIDGF